MRVLVYYYYHPPAGGPADLRRRPTPAPDDAGCKTKSFKLTGWTEACRHLHASLACRLFSVGIDHMDGISLP